MGLDNDIVNIWQQNVNKSPSCQHDLLSGNLLTDKGIKRSNHSRTPGKFSQYDHSI